ncbi:FliH/SctL family protein [Thermanaeromonas sp. C210]|uniref:FliH/SctL family protein n=1 Tax=Thermanaeromonas sp. C210 TaxID=2731925 RepID=UPI00155C0998|nr:FliH/SctL family protein [Thermanaeromonas sp. C210]GFN24149.1 flagellar assembly protein FliH [Thermanaeromonas sp. C210]
MLWWSRVIKEVAAPGGEYEVPVREMSRWWREDGEGSGCGEDPRIGERAAALLEDARREADLILQAAREEAEELKARAREEGYRAGWEEGRKAGFRAGAAEAEALREEAEGLRRQAGKVLEEARAAYRDTLRAAEEDILGLALEVAAKIIRRQVELAPEVVLDITRSALQRVAEGQIYTIYAAPADADFLRQRREELLQDMSAGARLQIVADEALQPGGFRVETENGFIDATVESQLEEVRRLLRAGGKGKEWADRL